MVIDLDKGFDGDKEMVLIDTIEKDEDQDKDKSI